MLHCIFCHRLGDRWVGLSWTFCIVPLVYLSLSVSVPYYLDYYSPVEQSEVRETDSSNSIFFFFFFFASGLLCYSRSFVFP